MLKIALVSFAVLCTTGAFADEVDVHAGPGPAVVAPGGAGDVDTSKTVVREHDSGAGCASTTVHKENDAGDSKTVNRTNC